MSAFMSCKPHVPKAGLSPLDKDCCPERKRRCPCAPCLLPVDHPPWFQCPPKCPRIKRPFYRRFPTDTELWYEKHQEYMDYTLEDRVMPAMAFWFYCDHIPDAPGSHQTAVDCRRQTHGVWDRPKDPWPPLPQGACPPPRECQPCGPGPWANPNLRRFFYQDCV